MFSPLKAHSCLIQTKVKRSFPRMRDVLAGNRGKRMAVTTTPGLTSFWNDENCVIFLFSERPACLDELLHGCQYILKITCV